MAVKKKAPKKIEQYQYSIDEVINRGGKVSSEIKSDAEQEDEEVRFTLRIPRKLLQKIDHDRESRVGKTSRNQWIIEAISQGVR